MEGRVPARTWALWSGGLVLLAVVVGLLGDIRVGSGSDAGGKLATARVMADEWTCDPDLGWWAAEWDPDARLHQIVKAQVVGDRYLQATSPMYQCAVMPLQRWFGPWGPVGVSILGALAAALAGGSIACRLGADARGQQAAFALIGLLGPASFYATDVWEHAPALGAVMVGIALVLGDPRPRSAALAGAAFGLAAVLRAEMVLYVGVFAVTALFIREIRRTWLRSWIPIASGGVALAATVVANEVFERVVLSSGLRADRSTALVERSSESGELGERIRTAFVTAAGLQPSDENLALAVGAAVVVVLLVHSRRLLQPGARLSPSESMAGAVVSTRWLLGPGFVPGLFCAAPFAAAGPWTHHLSPRHRWLVATALVSLPLIWLLQWPGNLVAQWGGRYLLPTSAILTAAGCSALPWRNRTLRRMAPLLASCALVGMLGQVWHVQRTSELGSLIDAIQDVPDDTVVISLEANLAREAGGSYGEVRWLAVRDGDIDLASEVVSGAAPQHLTIVRHVERPAPTFVGYRLTHTIERTALDREFVIERLVRR